MWDKIKRKNNIFQKIYEHNGFKGKDSISGPGSDLLQTKVVREILPEIISKFDIKSILDIPCGDFYWMKEVDLINVNYMGGDIVEELILANNSKYKSSNKIFLHLDLINDNLPDCDLIFCRDCLVHLPYKEIFKIIDNIKKSGIKYFLTTTFVNRKDNRDIKTGDWRPINLEMPPFNFVKPHEVINENCTENDGIYSDKSLGLWKVSDL
jgi:hypothetical protein